MQLVIDAASVEPPERPAALDDHIARLWRAVEQLIFTRSPHEHRRLVPDPAADNRRRSAETFLRFIDEPIPSARTVHVDRLRDPIAIIDKCLAAWPGVDVLPREARRALELVRADLVSLITP